MTRAAIEWVNVTADVAIIARESGEVWFHSPSGAKGALDPFAAPMTGMGAVGSTIGLLDGAINLGFSRIEKQPCVPGLNTRRLYRCLGGCLSHVGRHATKSSAGCRALQQAGEARSRGLS